MNPTIKLIAIDLDGTLLDAQSNISERTMRAIRRATEQGVMVVIATGRPPHTASPYVERLGLNTPRIYLQGLAIYNADGSVLHERNMEPETARRVLQFAQAGGYAAMVYNSRMKILTNQPNAHTERMKNLNEPEPELIPSIIDLPDRMPIAKVVLVDDPERVPRIRAELTAQLGDLLTVLVSLPHLLEALPPGTSKGSGLKMLLDDLNIDPAHVMAIGDAENDVEMLELAGFSVAVDNATAHVKSLADYVTASNNDDGVAQAIERFVLGER